MILHRPTDRLGRLARLMLTLSIAALLGGSLALGEENPSDSQSLPSKRSTKANSPDAKHEYFVTGQLTDAKTGEAIGGATVHVLIDTDRKTATTAAELIRSDVTDQQGRYRLAVPVGTGRIFGIELPPGFWADSKTKYQSFLTTLEQTVARVDLEAKRGPVLNVQIKPAEADVSVDDLRVSARIMKPKGMNFESAQVHTDKQGLAKIVLPSGGTEYSLSVFQRNPYVTNLRVCPETFLDFFRIIRRLGN